MASHFRGRAQCVCVFSCVLRLPPTLLSSLSLSLSLALSPLLIIPALSQLSLFLTGCFQNKTLLHPRCLRRLGLGIREDLGKMATEDKKLYTLADVAVHNTANDCWLIIEGKVKWIISFFFFLSFFGTVFITFSCMLPRKGCFICVNNMPYVSCSGNLGLLVLFLELSFLWFFRLVNTCPACLPACLPVVPIYLTSVSGDIYVEGAIACHSLE